MKRNSGVAAVGSGESSSGYDVIIRRRRRRSSGDDDGVRRVSGKLGSVESVLAPNPGTLNPKYQSLHERVQSHISTLGERADEHDGVKSGARYEPKLEVCRAICMGLNYNSFDPIYLAIHNESNRGWDKGFYSSVASFVREAKRVLPEYDPSPESVLYFKVEWHAKKLMDALLKITKRYDIADDQLNAKFSTLPKVAQSRIALLKAKLLVLNKLPQLLRAKRVNSAQGDIDNLRTELQVQCDSNDCKGLWDQGRNSKVAAYVQQAKALCPTSEELRAQTVEADGDEGAETASKTV